jgi:RimJ/RimL family protein N-acetyltransferase
VAEGFDGEFYGYVRFTEDEKRRISVSIALTEAQRGKGKGTELLRQACALFQESFPAVPLHALVLESNLASRHIFQKAGFVQTDAIQLNGRQFLCFSKQNPCQHLC